MDMEDPGGHAKSNENNMAEEEKWGVRQDVILKVKMKSFFWTASENSS